MTKACRTVDIREGKIHDAKQGEPMYTTQIKGTHIHNAEQGDQRKARDPRTQCKARGPTYISNQIKGNHECRATRGPTYKYAREPYTWSKGPICKREPCTYLRTQTSLGARYTTMPTVTCTLRTRTSWELKLKPSLRQLHGPTILSHTHTNQQHIL